MFNGYIKLSLDQVGMSKVYITLLLGREGLSKLYIKLPATIISLPVYNCCKDQYVCLKGIKGCYGNRYVFKG